METIWVPSKYEGKGQETTFRPVYGYNLWDRINAFDVKRDFKPFHYKPYREVR